MPRCPPRCRRSARSGWPAPNPHVSTKNGCDDPVHYAQFYVEHEDLQQLNHDRDAQRPEKRSLDPFEEGREQRSQNHHGYREEGGDTDCRDDVFLRVAGNEHDQYQADRNHDHVVAEEANDRVLRAEDNDAADDRTGEVSDDEHQRVDRFDGFGRDGCYHPPVQGEAPEKYRSEDQVVNRRGYLVIAADAAEGIVLEHDGSFRSTSPPWTSSGPTFNYLVACATSWFIAT